MADSVLVATLRGVARLREGEPPRLLNVETFWSSWFQVAGGCVFGIPLEDPRDVPSTRYHRTFLPTGADASRRLGRASHRVVSGGPESTSVWLYDVPDWPPPGGIARRVDPATGNVLDEVTLPDDASLAGSTDDRLLLQRGAQVTLRDLDGTDLVTVPGWAMSGHGRYAAIAPQHSPDPQPHTVLDLATTTTRQVRAAVTYASISPDGRWLAGYERLERTVIVKAVEIDTGRVVAPHNGALRRTWFTPAVAWSRDARNAYVVPFEGALAHWRPGETDLVLVSDLASHPFVVVE